MTEGSSCDITAKNSCCSSPASAPIIDYKEHWNATYLASENEKLGWYETDLSPTFRLINKTGLPKDARILNVGAGNTVLVDKLIAKKYTQVIATDISQISLSALAERNGGENIATIVDDLTNPTILNSIEPVDLWIDRAVLHFFTEEKDQLTYFNLLKHKIAAKGFALIAEYNLDGAKKCAGLPVYNYNSAMIADELGEDFRLIDHFNFVFTMPSGDLRPYVYTLFQRK